jgi:hypothetical protein
MNRDFVVKIIMTQIEHNLSPKLYTEILNLFANDISDEDLEYVKTQILVQIEEKFGKIEKSILKITQNKRKDSSLLQNVKQNTAAIENNSISSCSFPKRSSKKISDGLKKNIDKMLKPQGLGLKSTSSDLSRGSFKSPIKASKGLAEKVKEMGMDKMTIKSQLQSKKFDNPVSHKVNLLEEIKRKHRKK